MVRKSYTDEFRRRAVDLYESTPGATLRGIATDLGLSRGTLQSWAKELGAGVKTAGVTVPGESRSACVTRLEAENEALRVQARKLAEERDILRAAAKYFGGETNW